MTIIIPRPDLTSYPTVDFDEIYIARIIPDTGTRTLRISFRSKMQNNYRLEMNAYSGILGYYIQRRLITGEGDVVANVSIKLSSQDTFRFWLHARKLGILEREGFL